MICLAKADPMKPIAEKWNGATATETKHGGAVFLWICLDDISGNINGGRSSEESMGRVKSPGSLQIYYCVAGAKARLENAIRPGSKKQPIYIVIRCPLKRHVRGQIVYIATASNKAPTAAAGGAATQNAFAATTAVVHRMPLSSPAWRKARTWRWFRGVEGGLSLSNVTIMHSFEYQNDYGAGKWGGNVFKYWKYNPVIEDYMTL